LALCYERREVLRRVDRSQQKP